MLNYTLKWSQQIETSFLENADQLNDSGLVNMIELNEYLRQILGCRNCEEDEVSLR